MLENNWYFQKIVKITMLNYTRIMTHKFDLEFSSYKILKLANSVEGRSSKFPAQEMGSLNLKQEVTGIQ